MNDEFNHQFTMTLDPGWNINNLEIVGVIWSKQGSTYQFVNTNSTSELLAPTSTSDLANANFSMDIVPNISDRAVQVELALKESQEDLSIQVVDQLGRVVKNVYQGGLNVGTHHFQINRTEVDQAGLYFTVVNNGEQVVTQKVIFQ